MRELKCPKCGSVFTVDEADYASIVSQVKNAEFDAEVNQRVEEIKRHQESMTKMGMAMAEEQHQVELAKKDQALGEKDSEIAQLKAEIASQKDRNKLEIAEALTAKNQEIADLKVAINQGKSDLEIAILKERQIAREAAQAKDNEIAQLKADAKLEEKSSDLKIQALKEEYESKLRIANEQVDYYKDFKARMSTKMVGETLEVHCSTIFNGEMRSMLPNAYFEKDNDASEGSKGDFIFRDYVDGTEYISIMFEMKNEMDETATKHKNEDFFKKLDADRTAKGCDYAVLVSLLEPDSELYNGGIVDVSHRYPKMYVIRPQFFRAMISILVNAERKTVEVRKELELARSQSVDVTHFEEHLDAFKEAFGNNYRLAGEKFTKAIDEIDKSIDHLQKTREQLLGSIKQLGYANNKLEDLTIKKLTRGNPTMKAKFEEARTLKQEEVTEIS